MSGEKDKKREELEEIVKVLVELGDNIDIETCPQNPLDLMRGLITSLNMEIVDLLAERTKFKLNTQNYENPLPSPDQEDEKFLRLYGVKGKVFVRGMYLPCLSEICEEGEDTHEDFEKCLEIDRKLMKAVNKRILYGKPVGMHKGLWKIDTNVPSREKAVLDSVVAYSNEKEYSLDHEKLRNFFQKVMDYNKNVQLGHRQKLHGLKGKEIKTYKTGRADLIETMKANGIEFAQRQEPGKYVAKVKTEEHKGITTYLIEIHKA